MKKETSSQIIRRGSITTITLSNMKIRTNLINRHRYNDLRKLRHIKPKHVLWALKGKLK